MIKSVILGILTFIATVIAAVGTCFLGFGASAGTYLDSIIVILCLATPLFLFFITMYYLEKLNGKSCLIAGLLILGFILLSVLYFFSLVN